jgi:hypothetical protein
MIDVVVYHSTNSKPDEAYLAFVVLPDGNQWLVRFTGQTAAIAEDKARRLYEAERAKFAARNQMHEDDAEVDVAKPAADGRGHHFAGKAWMIHRVTRVKIRVPKADVASYLGEYDLGGARSK